MGARRSFRSRALSKPEGTHEASENSLPPTMRTPDFLSSTIRSLTVAPTVSRERSSFVSAAML